MASSSLDAPPSSFRLLPAELRLKIWSYASQPRVAILHDIVHRPGSYPLPAVTQLNAEARAESRPGYEPVGCGSHLHFARDILVCDASLCDLPSSEPLEHLAPRVRRLVFWDCYPDDSLVDGLHLYSAYLAACYPRDRYVGVDLDKLWFPNLDHLWIVKVGGVDESWNLSPDSRGPSPMQARQFRYWPDDDAVELSPLDIHRDPETRAVLQHGRCGRSDCRDLNRERPMTVSKVSFVDGPYVATPDWERIIPRVGDGCTEDTMRWLLVERTLTFSLRRDDSADDSPRRRLRPVSVESGCV
ncbi:hypothetical protein XA68_10606 [Ophiocordyceps unilateralis]|uniref:2EXR domain-containing protein n=1 Tax=Ophiocordyceps unilateralis TaxID=268505 RepID=A0A2A9PIK2_OPHUN|nr:hypothetical protein XA68_10606 [Ophiocordyceps unilateralis]